MITEEQSKIFKEFLNILRGSEGNEIALLQCKEKGTGRKVCLISYVTPPSELDDSYTITPLAELLMPGDIERYEDPTT
jgi:hypothetical protein